LTISSSVLTGCLTFPLSSTGTLMLWKRRLVRLEYCSWPSILDSSSIITTAKDHTLALKEHSTEVNALYNKIIELESRIEGQEQYSRRTSLRFRSVRYLVRFSVMKILSGWFFKPFLLLYTLLRVLYETNLTITLGLISTCMTLEDHILLGR
jgi:hypothetical protein